MSVPEEITTILLGYIEKVRDIVKYLSQGIILLNQIRVGEALKVFSKAIKTDTDADNMRRKLFDRLTELNVEPRIREDIMHLAKRFDVLSEWSKESARHLSIIPYLEIPAELRDKIGEMVKLALRSAEYLVEATKALIKGDLKKAREYANKVEHIEEEADEVNVAARKLLVGLGRKIDNPAVLIMIKDFIEALENITDTAEDAADVIRVLAIRGL